jgi:hypothetical protein
MALLRESPASFNPATFLVRDPEGACILYVEVHPGLSAVDRPGLIGEARRRLTISQGDTALIVTPFMVYMVAEPRVVAQHPSGGPALSFRFGDSSDPSPRLWDHFFGATRMLWRKAGLGEVAHDSRLIDQVETWLGRLTARGLDALCLQARGGVGLAHAMFSLRLPMLRESRMGKLPHLLGQRGESPGVVIGEG